MNEGSDPAAGHWRRLQEIFAEAREADRADRERLLHERCGDDVDLLLEVRSLLDADADAGALDALAPRMRSVIDMLDDSLPDHVGPYRIDGEVGRGGMGVVFRGFDPRLQRNVALKVVAGDLPAELAARQRFINEARAASALDHPNICTIYDIGTLADGRTYLAMAYYGRGTLADRLKQGPLPVADAVEIARQLADALDCAHEAGIVHRDVKPRNVAFGERGEARLLDFGVALLGHDHDASGPTAGTPGYMAPEQVRGERVDRRADVWGLGVVLFEMLCGRRPFVGDRADVMRAITEDDAPPVTALRADVPRAVAAIVEHALRRDPADRIASAAAFERALRTAAIELAGGAGRAEDAAGPATGDAEAAAAGRAAGTAGVGLTSDSVRGDSVHSDGVRGDGVRGDDVRGDLPAPTPGVATSGVATSGVAAAVRVSRRVRAAALLLLVGTAAAVAYVADQRSHRESDVGSLTVVDASDYYLRGRDRYHADWDELEAAITLLRSAVEHAPDHAPAHAFLARAYARATLPDNSRQGQLIWVDSAEVYAQRALTLAPQLPDGHSALGSVARARGEREAALAHHERALAIDPDYVYSIQETGEIYQELQQIDRSIRLRERALALDPSLDEVRTELAITYRTWELPDEAMAHIRAGLQLRPDNGSVLWEAAQLELLFGDTTIARAFLDRFLLLLPSFERDRLSAWFEYIKGNYDAALPHVERVAPAATEFYDLRMYGMVYGAVGDTTRGRPLLRRAAELLHSRDQAPGAMPHRLHFMLAHIYAGLGQPAEALHWLASWEAAGGFRSWRELHREWGWAPLRDDTEFLRIVARTDSVFRQQRRGIVETLNSLSRPAEQQAAVEGAR